MNTTIQPLHPRIAQPLRFSGQQAPAPRFGSIEDKFENFKRNPKAWVKLGLAGVVGLFSIVGLFKTAERNPDNVRSVVVHKWGNGPSPDVRGGGQYVFMAPFITDNIQVDVTSQSVKDTLHPYSQDGVKVNGDGQDVNEGVDIRLNFELDPGPDKKYASVYNLVTHILGSTQPTQQALASETAVFTSDNEITRRIYFQEILPRLKADLSKLTLLSDTEDFHTIRGFLDDAITNGYQHKDADGKVLWEIRPLGEQLKELGIKLNLFEISALDLPGFLNDQLKERASLPLKLSNQTLKIKENQAAALAARETVKIQNAKNLEATKGQVNASIAKAEGERLEMEQQMQKLIAEAEGKKNARIAEAKGKALAKVADAEGKKKATVEEARGIAASQRTQAEGEAQAVVKAGEAKGSALAAEGQALTDLPQLMKQIAIENNREARIALANRIGLILVDPDTPLDENVFQIGAERYQRLPGVKTPPANEEAAKKQQ